MSKPRPRILFVTEHPASIYNGVGWRVQQTLSGLKLAGDVHTLLLLKRNWQTPTDNIDTTLIRTEASSKISVLMRWLIGRRPRQSHIQTAHRREVRRLLSQTWDLVWFLRARPHVTFGHLVSSSVVVDLDDLNDLLIDSRIKTATELKIFSLNNLMAKADINRWRKIHANMAKRVRSIVVCKDEDKQHLKTDQAAVEVIFNGYPDVAPVWQSGERQHYVIFVGAYNYPPNAQAAVFLARQVLPIIRRSLADFRLLLIGQPAASINEIGDLPGVEVLGRVDDLASYYAQCSCAAIPLFSGSGTSLKAIEALAFGVPLIASKFGLRGLSFEHNNQAVIAEDAVTFAGGIVRLASDPEYATRLAQAGRQHFQRHLRSSIAMQGVRDLALRSVYSQKTNAITLAERE